MDKGTNLTIIGWKWCYYTSIYNFIYLKFVSYKNVYAIKTSLQLQRGIEFQPESLAKESSFILQLVPKQSIDLKKFNFYALIFPTGPFVYKSGENLSPDTAIYMLSVWMWNN